VKAFRVERENLFGYAEAAHQATIERINHLATTRFAEPVEHPPGTSRPAWQALAGMCGDSYQHAGQIAYLRGMITGYGWR
jgi:hypothetical protein